MGSYIWVEDYHGPPADATAYVIGVGDTLQIRVFNQDQLSTTKAKVRADGKISMPLLNDVDAVGTTPTELGQKIETMLKGFVKNPLVTVSLEETRPQVVYVTGEVPKPGMYPLEATPGVLQAIANAGGLGPDASSDRIFVLRQTSPPVRIRFKYRSLVHESIDALTFRLRAGDVVVVE